MLQGHKATDRYFQRCQRSSIELVAMSRSLPSSDIDALLSNVPAAALRHRGLPRTEHFSDQLFSAQDQLKQQGVGR